MESHDRAQGFLDRIDTLLNPMRQEFQEWLLTLEGTNENSLEANHRLAALIQENADALRIAFRCTRCEQPARFKCVSNRTMKTGMFTFAHSGGTHTGTAKIPKLLLTEPAPDGRARHSSASPNPMPETPDLPPMFLEEIETALIPFRERFQGWLRALKGQNSESAEAARALATRIQTTADTLRVLFTCVKCGEPARLRCVAGKKEGEKYFQFGHSSGTTHGGGSAVPELTIVSIIPQAQEQYERLGDD